MEINWYGATRYHDWFKDDFKTVRGMVKSLTAIGIIGIPDWKRIGVHGSEKKLQEPERWLDELLATRSKQRTTIFQVAAGGASPAKWSITIMLMPFDKKQNVVLGYNLINCLFENELFLTPAGSDTLYSTFRKMHTVENTEFAMIHPYLAWRNLDDTLTGPYGNPLTFSPMFTGVSWANFLGPGQVAYFDITKIKQIKHYNIEWIDNKGAYMRASQNISDAVGKEVETQIIGLTGEFRNALLKK